MRLLFASAILFSFVSGDLGAQQHVFHEPIDAISFGLSTDHPEIEVSGLIGDTWGEWHTIEIEKEFDPELRESNLILFPRKVSAIRVRGPTKEYVMHPIRISDEPIRTKVAARTPVGTPRVLSRREWGANESFLYSGQSVQRSDVRPTGDNGDVSARAKECEAAKLNYPNEFKISNTKTTGPNGKTLRWPQRYSPRVTQLVVHHTALKVRGDERTPVERMRALYEYHANSRGWGDVGYHYLIDENGQVYEGRAGGDHVVGGHVYCGNIGTVGIALMGNFELEQPTQQQMKALQWMLDHLAKKYNIDARRTVQTHGRRLPTIVSHKDLISTACPGFYVRESMTQVRNNVVAGKLSNSINFARMSRYSDRTANRKASRISGSSSRTQPTLTAIGSTQITTRPGGEAILRLQYRAGNNPVQSRARIAAVGRSNSRIGLWQDINGREQRIRNEIVLPQMLRAHSTQTLRIRVQVPRESGVYMIDIDNITYEIQAQGRRIRTPETASPVPQSFRPASIKSTRLNRRRSTSTVARPSSYQDKAIRIRLGYEKDTAALIGIRSVNNKAVDGTIDLKQSGTTCVASRNGKVIDSGIIRLNPGGSITTISSWNTLSNQFRGIIECRIVDDQLVLINELPLEQYIQGLAEEPDTEPYEKQRAFAIAARSYAAHYMQPQYRKFPGKPYDGDDSPARFQKYGGVRFETSHPSWVRAAKSTAGKVLKKNGEIIKAAYFSSDDGRTRSPAERGWINFPFAEVFRSKPDPWCNGMPLWGHGVGMSGCGSEGQAYEGKKAEEILQYYYEGTVIDSL